ncbi:MAG: hypothetical protein WBL80_06300, partial [Erysipelotrichaceae bacterium]
IIIQSEVINLGEEFWKRVERFGKERKIISEREISFLDIACRMTRKIPSEAQCRVLLEILEKVKGEGFHAE